MDTLSTIDALQNGIIEKSTQEKKDSPAYHFDKRCVEETGTQLWMMMVMKF